MQPYRGLRVLDFGQGIASPYTGHLLALNGAEVIKVEPPEGDWGRWISHRPEGDISVMFAAYNRGKRSIMLDLKKTDGHAIAQRLADQADVVIEAFRPGVMQRMRLDYETLKKTNPNLVYISISGFGQDGPNAERRCSDSVVQAFSGLAAMNRGNDGIPHRVGVFAGDVITGLFGFMAVQSALAARARGDGGAYLDVDLAQGTAALVMTQVATAAATGNDGEVSNVPAGSYQTSDGFIIVSLVKEAHFVALCEAIGRPDMAKDPRFGSNPMRGQHEGELRGIFRDVFRTATTDAWLARLKAADVLGDRISSPRDMLTDPHIAARNGIMTFAQPGLGKVSIPRTSGQPDGSALSPAPALGQHTVEILAELG
ncbi:MAG: CoA transferase [Acetobacteraceae bacterium]|nr:CoA transferase [Acetobacteraceae bacterium]